MFFSRIAHLHWIPYNCKKVGHAKISHLPHWDLNPGPPPPNVLLLFVPYRIVPDSREMTDKQPVTRMWYRPSSSQSPCLKAANCKPKWTISWDVVARKMGWLISSSPEFRSRVRLRHLPQWSWCAAGSLFYNLENLRVGTWRETYPWDKKLYKKLFHVIVPVCPIRIRIKRIWICTANNRSLFFRGCRTRTRDICLPGKLIKKSALSLTDFHHIIAYMTCTLYLNTIKEELSFCLFNLIIIQ